MAAARSAMIEYLRANLTTITGEHAKPMLEQVPMSNVLFNSQKELDALVEGAAWSLVADGIIVPGTFSNRSGGGVSISYGFPGFRITPFGKAILAKPEIDPLDTATFVADASSRLSGADAGVFEYLSEADRCFVAGLDLAAAVMLRVAAETLMRWLIKQYLVHIPDRKRAEHAATFSKNDRNTEKLFAELSKGLDYHKEEFSDDIARRGKPYLDQLAILMRTHGNDAAHGKADYVDHDLMRANLLFFPTMLSFASQIAGELSKHCTRYRE